jgi:MFS family permease
MDKVGPFNVATSTAAFALMVMLCFWIPFGTSSAACLYAVAGFFGFGTGAFVSTSVACVVALCHAQDAGKYLGSAWTVISLGVLASNPASHAVMDTGTVHLVWLLSATVGLSLAAGLVVRWECLGRRWVWLAKV